MKISDRIYNYWGIRGGGRPPPCWTGVGLGAGRDGAGLDGAPAADLEEGGAGALLIAAPVGGGRLLTLQFCKKVLIIELIN